MSGRLVRIVTLLAALGACQDPKTVRTRGDDDPPTPTPTPTPTPSPAPGSRPPDWLPEARARAEKALLAKHGDTQRPRIDRGLQQVASFWRAEDGDAAAFEAFALAQFAGDQAALDALFDRFQLMFEKLDGHMQEAARELRAPTDLDLGPLYPVDELFGGYDPAAHLTEDFFRNKLAFVALLNFPLTTLETRAASGKSWSRRQWAEARLAQRFSRRVPADVQLAAGEALAKNEQYINGYNIWMYRVLAAGGKRLFPEDLRLLSHWNLRDEIRADYADQVDGPAKQQLIQTVMERIVTQTIPAKAIDGKDFDWDPAAPAAGAEREPDTRYARILAAAAAFRRADPYSPTAPTYIARVFEDRELPEERVKKMLEQVLESPVIPRVAALIRARLGRNLQPYDIWYTGFSARGTQSAAELDALTARRYPTAQAYQRDIPNLLTRLGFSKERAGLLAGRIAVEPARGSGHAMGAAMRGEKARLRTRVEKTGMNYKGFNIAVHEMGHNVEQVFSLEMIDHTLLAGVPANAFTEALAFVFQARDLQLLGLPPPPPESHAEDVLHELWATYEIAGVALVEMAAWHWIYDHPNATPAELRQAMLEIAKDTWNRWYAPVFRTRDSVILGIYSHMVNYPLYLADYPIGHMIAFQIEEQVRKAGDLGGEFERMARIGSVTPDLWMETATGAPVGPEALLRAAEAALAQVEK